MIDLRTLEVFYWVVKLGGFGRAAEKLHTTQPAVSGRIAQLEQSFSIRLLDRSRGRKLALTPKGLEVLAYAERMLTLQAELQAALTAPSGLRGTVRLGVSETIVQTWLSTLVRRLHDVCPQVTPEITVDISAGLRNALLAGELDVALLLGPVSEPRVQNLDLGAAAMVWAARPDLAVAGDPPGLADLARWPILTYARGTRPHMQIAEMFSGPSLPAPRIFANSSITSIIRMAIDGIGIGAVPEAVIGRELADGSLRILKGAPVLQPLAFTASWIDTPGSGLAATIARLAHDVAHGVDKPEGDKRGRSTPIGK